MSHNYLAELSLKKVMCFRHTKTPQSRKVPEGFPEVVPEGFSTFSSLFALLVPFSMFFLPEAITFLPFFEQKS
jgi:hypothetical protein